MTALENLSVPAGTLRDMSNTDVNDPRTTTLVFADPVSYLASFGIDAEIVVETAMPAAA